MAIDLAAPKPGWVALLRDHARLHAPAAWGLGVGLLGVSALLVQSLAQVASGNAAPGLRLALLGGVAGFTTTALGALPALAVLVAVASGALEPVGALLGVGLSSGLALAYPAGLGLAAGAMIFVVSHKVIPQTHRNGHQTPATLGLMTGFALMMVLDTTLG
jgi:zinc transporter, ZIP family